MASTVAASNPSQPELAANKENGSVQDAAQEQKSQAGAEPKPEGGVVTVFHDPQNFTVKHPLMNKWSLWFTKPATKKGNESWADLLKKVNTFESVEEFWGVYNNFPLASSLPLKADVHLFKEGIRPEWEDRQNKNGGRWLFEISSRSGDFDADKMWLNLLLAVIGETLEVPGDDEVRGVVFSVRRQLCRIALWTASSTEKRKKNLLAVGMNFKKALGLDESITIGFSSHRESNSRSKSSPWYTV